MEEAAPSPPSSLRWVLPVTCGLIMFTNHYARDTLGTVQVQMERDFPMSPGKYGDLNSVYYAPNVVMPVIAGLAAQRFPGTFVLLLFVFVSACGHLVFAWGVARGEYAWLLGARCILGLCYEAIDMGSIPFMSALFKDEWAFIVGVTNGLLRGGSVATFFASPRVYKARGLDDVLYLGSAVGAAGFAFAALTSAVVALIDRRNAAAKRVSSWRDAALEHHETVEAQASSSSYVDDDGPGPTRRTRREAPSEAAEADATTKKAMGALFCALPAQYWLFLLGGALMYAALVPWLTLGSKILQARYDIGVTVADAAMLMPEGAIVVLCPPLGILVDRAKVRSGPKLAAAACGAACFPLAFGLTSLWPDRTSVLLPSLILALGWSVFNTLFWASLTDVIPAESVSLGAGILGGVMNLGASFLPTILAVNPPNRTLVTLAALSAAGALAILAAAFATPSASTKGGGNNNNNNNNNNNAPLLQSDHLRADLDLDDDDRDDP